MIMEKNLSDALGDINSIKSTIDNTKVNISGMYKMCFMLGAYHTIRSLFIIYAFLKPSFLNIFSIFYPIMTILFFTGFLLICRKEEKYTNKYYLSFINIWRFLVVILPIMTSIINYLNYGFFNDDVTYDILFTIQNYSDILLFCIFLIIYSYIINKKNIYLIVLLLLFIYMLLSTCFRNIGIPIHVDLSYRGDIPYINFFKIGVVGLGYIILGILLKKRKNI